MSQNFERKIWIHWNMTADNIVKSTNDLINKSRINNDKIANFKLKSKNDIPIFLGLLSDDITEFTIYHSMSAFLQYVSPNADIRKASAQVDNILSKYGNELNMRKDVYMKIKEFYDFAGKTLEPIDVRFIERLIKIYERNGTKLNDVQYNTLLKVKHEISKLENSVHRFVIDHENDIISLTKDELNGLPSSCNYIIQGTQNYQYNIPLNKQSYITLMKYLTNSQTREKIEVLYSKKYNPIIETYSKLIVLRDKHAKLLSYDCHSNYKAELMMTKNCKNIKNFLTELLERLNYRYKKEYDTLLKHKQTDKNMSKNTSDVLNSWDISYYMNKWKQEYGVDENVIKEYFQLSDVVDKILKIYEAIFNINFSKIDDSSVWHQDVDTYKVSDKSTGELIGYLYLDLYYRKGKYRITRCFSLQPPNFYPYNSSNNTYQIPHVSLVSSFDKNENGNTYLYHHDVVSLFHEMCHAFHCIYGKTKYIIFSGFNVENDFIETPAQVLDFLCWEKNILKLLSSHHRTGEKIDDGTLDKLIKIKNLDVGFHYKKSILTSLFDQLVYSSDNFISLCENSIKSKSGELNILISNLYKQVYSQVMTNYQIVVNTPADNYFPVEWIHNINNDAQYYCYTWSRVLAADLYAEKFKNKIIDKDLGIELRNKILKYGGSKNAYELICDYLGRKPDIDGFIHMYDLDIDVEYSFFMNTEAIKKNHQVGTNVNLYNVNQQNGNQQNVNQQNVNHQNVNQQNVKPQIISNPAKNINATYETNKNINAIIQSEYDDDEVSNKFSEINESSVEFNTIESNRNYKYVKNKLNDINIVI